MPAAKFLFAILFLHGLVKEVFSDREEDSNGSVSRALESILDSTDSGGEDIYFEKCSQNFTCLLI